jgi:RHS repeat-associated protein
VAEYTANAAPASPLKEYGYRGGQLLVTTDGGRVKWLVGDHLGTPRMVVDQSGDLTGANQVIRHDYLPFGEEILVNTGIRTTTNGYVGDGIRQKFTGKDRDSETGLDYFEARYYAGKQGRFTSPDEFSGGPDDLFDFADVASENPTLYGDLTEPQSLNKYQYCYNNPLSFVDLDGHKGLRSWLKTGLEIASYIPGPIGTGASLVQAGVALAQGDYKGAALAAAGAIPGGKILAAAGAAVTTVAVIAVVVRKVVKAADKADDAASGVSQLSKTVKKAEGGGEAAKNIPKPPTGKGTVPPNARDPKRLFTRGEVDAGLKKQGDRCPQCGNEVDLRDARGHHIKRHADGGETKSSNLAVLCKSCHKEIHKP